VSAELISILALVVIFVLATTLSVNMGALAFAGAFLVGTLAGGPRRRRHLRRPPR